MLYSLQILAGLDHSLTHRVWFQEALRLILTDTAGIELLHICHAVSTLLLHSTHLWCPNNLQLNSFTHGLLKVAIQSSYCYDGMRIARGYCD